MFVCFVLLLVNCVYAQANDCVKWQAYVDPKLNAAERIDLRKIELGENVIEGIACLLKLKGKTYSSEFSVFTDGGISNSSRRPSPSVEVLALYSISYFYHQDWKHAYSIRLYENGKKNKKSTIKKAYKAYQSWFEKVKEIGLEEARKQKLDPLAGSGVRWY